MKEHNHPFHLVNPSPWPIATSFSCALLMLAIVGVFHHWEFGWLRFITGLSLLLSSVFFWWIDVIFEVKKDKVHNQHVQHGLKTGMLIFLLSETAFFAAFFGAFFYLWVAPVNIFENLWSPVNGTWPPNGIQTINPWGLPFLNTIILLLSGTSVTWAHHEAAHGKAKNVTYGLLATISLGILFSAIQAYEYSHSVFPLKAPGYQSFYTTLFYACTGFHGLHVILGTVFLIVALVRNLRGSFTDKHHLGLEFAAWYWHFVDVVWIFLFVFLYVLAR